MQNDVVKGQFENFLLPGAATVGIKCKDGVVLASENRLTFGRMILSKAVKKVFKIADNIGVACAGLVSDFQKLQSIIIAQLNLYNIEERTRISPKSAAKLVANILYRNKYFPFFTNTVIGGADEKGSYLYTLDLIGSLLEDEFATLGSGAEISIGVIEKKYKKDMTVEDGKKLAIEAISAASKRDPTSGEAIDVLVIKNDSVQDFHTKIL